MGGIPCVICLVSIQSHALFLKSNSSKHNQVWGGLVGNYRSVEPGVVIKFVSNVLERGVCIQEVVQFILVWSESAPIKPGSQLIKVGGNLTTSELACLWGTLHSVCLCISSRMHTCSWYGTVANSDVCRQNIPSHKRHTSNSP